MDWLLEPASDTCKAETEQRNASPPSHVQAQPLPNPSKAASGGGDGLIGDIPRRAPQSLRSGGLGDDAARTATLPALLRAAVALAPTASGGVRFFSTRVSENDEEPPKRVIYPQALKDQLEKEGKLQEWTVGTQTSNPCNRTKEYNLEQDLMIQRALAEQQREFYSMCITRQSEHDVKMTATRAEFEKKLSAQNNEYEVKLAAVRVEFEGKLNEQRKEYAVKVAASAKECDDKYNSLKSFVDVNYKEYMDKANEAGTSARLLAQRYDDFKNSSDVKIDSVKYSFYKGIGGMATVAGGVIATYRTVQEELPKDKRKSIAPLHVLQGVV